LIDDDQDDYLIIRNLLGRIPQSPFKLEWVSSFDEAHRAIGEKRHDIYLVDYRLGADDGIELLEQFDLIQRPEPFIILTGAGDERVEREAMRMGAADYLVKGSLDSELLSRVMRYSLQRKISEAQRVHQLIEINRSKDEFIALASHQLRTPATAVKQYIGMILEGYAGDISPDQERFLRSAYESNERQIQVVNDILRVAKLDLKKINLKRAEIDVGKLVESILTDSASLFENRNQNIKYSVPKKPIEALVDTEYIRMALGNIIDNASKYTPQGKTITVKVGRCDNADHALVSIIDEGVGIADDDLDKLFKKFSRIDNPLSVKVGGTGLGLYWSNEIVQLHGGEIDVRSATGGGTTFNIHLPQNMEAKPKKKTGISNASSMLSI
jgi:two-component system, sensor histidine kinase and response regulator